MRKIMAFYGAPARMWNEVCSIRNFILTMFTLTRVYVIIIDTKCLMEFNSFAFWQETGDPPNDDVEEIVVSDSEQLSQLHQVMVDKILILKLAMNVT